MDIDVDLYSSRHIPLQSSREFIEEILPQLGWGKTDGYEVVLDVGCLPGGTFKEFILPMFSSTSRIFAMDPSADMIALAKSQNSSPQIEYHVANIEDWSSVQGWKNQITKLVSICFFHWLKDQRQGFRNVYQLLKKGGEAAIFFLSQSAYYDALLEMQNGPKWSHYYKGIENYVPDSHRKGYCAYHYQKMLEELGFEVLNCRNVEKTDTFPSEKVYRDFKLSFFSDFYNSVCILRNYMPPERLEEFENDWLNLLIKKNGRDVNGVPYHKGCFMEIVVRKT